MKDTVESLENALATVEALIEQKERDLFKIESELDQTADPDDYEALSRCVDKQRRHKKVGNELQNLVIEQHRITRSLERIGAYA